MELISIQRQLNLAWICFDSTMTKVHDHIAFNNIKGKNEFELNQIDQGKSFLTVVINNNGDYCSLTVRVLQYMNSSYVMVGTICASSSGLDENVQI